MVGLLQILSESRRKGKGFLQTWPKAEVTAFICGACGYVVLRVDPHQFDTLRAIFEGANWTHIELTERQDD